MRRLKSCNGDKCGVVIALGVRGLQKRAPQGARFVFKRKRISSI